MKSTSKSQATIALPPAMLRQVDDVSKREHRTRSELVREALRVYFNRDSERELLARIARLPVAIPTAEERRAIEKGRRSFGYMTLDEFNAWLLAPDRKNGRAKKSAPRTPSRARTARGGASRDRA